MPPQKENKPRQFSRAYDVLGVSVPEQMYLSALELTEKNIALSAPFEHPVPQMRAIALLITIKDCMIIIDTWIHPARATELITRKTNPGNATIKEPTVEESRVLSPEERAELSKVGIDTSQSDLHIYINLANMLVQTLNSVIPTITEDELKQDLQDKADELTQELASISAIISTNSFRFLY